MMSKKRRRLEIKVMPLPTAYSEETASCPVCGKDALAIGRAGAINAALLAASVLALSDSELAKRLEAWRQRQADAASHSRASRDCAAYGSEYHNDPAYLPGYRD